MATSTAEVVKPPRKRMANQYPDFHVNEHGRLDCIVQGCRMHGPKGSKSKGALTQHLRNIHDMDGKAASKYAAKHPQPTEQPPANGNGHALARHQKPNAAARMGTPLTLEIPFDREMRVSAAINGLNTIDKYLNYCPRCGYDLEKIKQITRAPCECCPTCKLNLITVRMSLAPDLIDLEPGAVAKVFGVMRSIVQGGK